MQRLQHPEQQSTQCHARCKTQHQPRPTQRQPVTPVHTQLWAMNLALRVVLPGHPHKNSAQQAAKAQADKGAGAPVLFHQPIMVLRTEALNKEALYAAKLPAKA